MTRLIGVGYQFPGGRAARCLKSGCVRFLGGGFGKPGRYRLTFPGRGRLDGFFDL